MAEKDNIQLTIEMAELKTKVNSIDDKVESIEGKLDKFIEGCETKFASKLVEKIVYGLVALVLTGVGGALLTLAMNG